MNYITISSIALGCILLLFLSACKKNILGNNGKSVDLSHSQVNKDIVYGRNIDWLGNQQDLKMDIYSPKDVSVTTKKYPVLVFVHGGGFLKGDKSTTEEFAALMNRKGFAVATINYRLGWTVDPVDECNADSVEALKAVYRAIQDTRASLRFIAAYADKYHLDANLIFLGGSSAGGMSALNANYFTQSTADMNYPGFSKILGPLDAGNDLKNIYSVKAMVNMWGAIDNLDIITRANAKPTIFFHGMMDNVVSYDVGHLNSCDKMPLGYGSKPIYDRLTDYGISAIAHIDPTGSHGVYDVSFQTNNIACFLNGVMTGKKQTGYFYNSDGDCGNN